MRTLHVNLNTKCHFCNLLLVLNLTMLAFNVGYITNSSQVTLILPHVEGKFLLDWILIVNKLTFSESQVIEIYTIGSIKLHQTSHLVFKYK